MYPTLCKISVIVLVILCKQLNDKGLEYKDKYC